MLAPVRAGLFAALVTLASIFAAAHFAVAADKAFQRDDLAEAAIKLEAQIKSDAGQVGKAARRNCAARPTRRSSATTSAAAWCCSGRSSRSRPTTARTGCGSPAPSCRSARPTTASATSLLERAATAAYIAYQRAGNRSEEADSLRDHRPQLRRPAALAAGARCAAAVARTARGRRRARALRDACARTTASACSTTRSMPTPPRRAPASSSPRSCPASAPISRRSSRSPASTSRRCRPRRSSSASRGSSTASATASRCAPACRRPSRRRWRSRPTSPSTCATASRSCALPARPMCCRAPASAAFRWSASTPRRWTIAIYRIGDRNLIDTVLGRDFQRNLDRYDVERLTESRGIKVWNGELAVEQTLNAEVTTAFPVDQAVGDLAPGVYVMTAAAKGTPSDDYDALATQWFIVSDLGLTAFSGNDGINVFVNSLATTEPKGAGRGAADVAQQRDAGHQAHRRRRPRRSSRPGSRAARARWRPPCWSPPSRRATTPSSA